MKLYFLYARVSDDRYLESLETQIGLLKDMANAPNNGYKYDDSTIICEHDSGSSGGRPEFSKMIEMLTEDSKRPPKDRQYAGVIFFKIDRLFRNFQDFNQVERLMGLGYRFVSITETIENTPTGRLLFRMLAGFAIYESDKLSNRQSFSNLTNSLKGNFERLGSRLVTGYEIRKVGAKRRVRINQAEAALIRFIYDLKIQNPASPASVLAGLVLNSEYAGVLTGIIQAAIDRRVSSKLKWIRGRARIDEIRWYPNPSVTAEAHEPELPIEGDNLRKRAEEFIRGCLQNDSAYLYDGRFVRTFDVNDELIKNFLGSISSWDEERYRQEFGDMQVEWDDNNIEIGSRVTFTFFDPELLIVPSETYRKVHEASARKATKRSKRPGQIGLFDGLLFLRLPDSRLVLMNSYLTSKNTVSYRRNVNGKTIERTEYSIQKALSSADFFKNRKQIEKYKTQIMTQLEDISKKRTRKFLQGKKIAKMAYERELRSLNETRSALIKNGNDQESLFVACNAGIKHYTQVIAETEQEIRQIREQETQEIEAFFYLLNGNIDLRGKEERFLANSAMFERLELDMGRDLLTVRLHRFFSQIL